MAIRVLVIDQETKGKIAELVRLASESVRPFAEMQAAEKFALERRAQNLPPVINPINEAFTVEIPSGFFCTFTHEEQPGRVAPVVCRHLSISQRDTPPGCGVHPVIVNLILQEFGFKNPLAMQPAVFLEDLENGSFAVNVIEPLDGDLERFDYLRQPPGPPS